MLFGISMHHTREHPMDENVIQFHALNNYHEIEQPIPFLFYRSLGHNTTNVILIAKDA